MVKRCAKRWRDKLFCPEGRPFLARQSEFTSPNGARKEVRVKSEEVRGEESAPATGFLWRSLLKTEDFRSET